MTTTRCPACDSDNVTEQKPDEGRTFSCENCGLEFFDFEEVHVYSADELRRLHSSLEKWSTQHRFCGSPPLIEGSVRRI